MAEARRTKDVARKDHAKRVLVWLFAGIIVLISALGFGVVKSDATWAPKLGLDLSGGTQIVLEPRVDGDQKVTQDQLDEARDIGLSPEDVVNLIRSTSDHSQLKEKA